MVQEYLKAVQTSLTKRTTSKYFNVSHWKNSVMRKLKSSQKHLEKTSYFWINILYSDVTKVKHFHVNWVRKKDGQPTIVETAESKLDEVVTMIENL